MHVSLTSTRRLIEYQGINCIPNEKSIGIDGKLFQTTQTIYLYQEYNCCVKINDLMTNRLALNCRLKHGYLLSSTLFNIIINDLIDKLKKGGVGIPINNDTICIMLYADNM